MIRDFCVRQLAHHIQLKPLAPRPHCFVPYALILITLLVIQIAARCPYELLSRSLPLPAHEWSDISLILLDTTHYYLDTVPVRLAVARPVILLYVARFLRLVTPLRTVSRPPLTPITRFLYVHTTSAS